MIRAKMLAIRAGRHPAGPTDMARDASDQRLVPDPSITIPKLIAMLKAFQRIRGSNDITLALRDLKKCISWSCASSRCINAICGLNDLFELAMELGENGMLPRAGLRDALIRLNTEKDDKGDVPHRWNFSVRADSDAASELGTIIRTGLRKLRDCKKSESEYSRALDKQDEETVDKFNNLLDMMELQNTKDAQSHVFEEVVNDVDTNGLSNVFDRCLCPDFDFRPMQPAEATEAGTHTKGMAFIMSMQMDSDDGPSPPLATPRRSPSQDSIGSHTLLRLSTKLSRASSQDSLNFDTVTIYNDDSTTLVSPPPVSNSSMASRSAAGNGQAKSGSVPAEAPAMQGNNSMEPRRWSDLNTPNPKSKSAAPLVSPEKQTSFVFKTTDVKPVVRLIGKTAPKPLEQAKKSMKKKTVVKAGGPVVRAKDTKSKKKT